MVNFEWYRTFKAIYQHGNLTRAAEALLVSQPSVSLQLASLENYIGHKLFIRKPRKLIPTEYGKMLYTQVIESVENLEKVETEFRKNALQRSRDIRLGSPIEYAQQILLPKIGQCDANMYLKFGVATELMDDLEKKDLDFVIATQYIEKLGIVYEPLEEEQFMLLAHSSLATTDFEQHIASNNLQEEEKWLLEQKWISYDNKLSIIRRFWRDNFNKRPLIKPHYIVPNISIMIDSVQLGYGIAIVSDLFIKEENLPENTKIIWKGKEETINQLWLAYNPLNVEEEKVREMKKALLIE